MNAKDIEIKGYQKNIERLTLFYDSDFYKNLSHRYPDFIAKVTDALYEDGDLFDESLYQVLSHKYNLPIIKVRGTYALKQMIDNSEIILGADIICGYKSLMKCYPNFNEWIAAYSLIRSKKDLHFLWPRHNLPTINTLRYSVYGDRIDYTLFDLKKYFAGEKTLLMSAYNQPLTKKWLEQFQGDFSLFINKMKLNMFVDDEYNVLNIEGQDSKIIEEIPNKSTIKKSVPLYIEGILALIKTGIFE